MSKTVFDHVNAIYTNQTTSYYDNLSDADMKSFSAWMVNRIISMNPDYIDVVNEIQRYYSVMTSRDLYLFYINLLPKRKQFNKYIKSRVSEKYDAEVVELLGIKYQIGIDDVQSYMDIFLNTDDGRTALHILLSGFGIPDKRIKKMIK